MSNQGEDVDRRHIERLYRLYAPSVHRRARVLLGSEAAAHDAVQDVFIKLLGQHAEFRAESSTMTWLYRITTNYCINRLRDEKRRRELDAQLDAPEAGSGRQIEITPDIRRVLASVPPKVAHAVIFHCVDGMTHDEVAAALGISRRSVGNFIQRFQQVARKRFGVAVEGT